MDASLIKRLKELEGENRRLKNMCAEQRINADFAREALQKNQVRPSRRKEVAQQATVSRALSMRLACQSVDISETCYRHQPVLTSENRESEVGPIKLTEKVPDWGFGLCFDYLRNLGALPEIISASTGSTVSWP